MKCDDCLNLLEEYLDGEASARDAELVNLHLNTCANCANELEALTAELELYARYDRELEVLPSMWHAIAARTVAQHSATDSRKRFSFGEWLTGLLAMPRYGFAGALAVLVVAIAIGLVYLRTRPTTSPVKQDEIVKTDNSLPINLASTGSETVKTLDQAPITPVKHPNGPTSPTFGGNKSQNSNQPDVLDDVAYTDVEDKDTASHLDQAQNLLLSFRSIKYSDDDEQVDVSYEKTESRRLLNENVVLRRDAEMNGKFPAKSVLGSLEPFLIDIANLPDQAAANDVRQIKDRMQKTEIVAELRSY